MGYFQRLNPRIREYFEVLEPEFPKWINDYVETDAMLHQQYISVTCGTIYSDLFESSFFFSSLDHSVAVALIIWHFTHDKKQTLAGLFHDIATPAFKHCVDFMNGDYMKQESTEDQTTQTIMGSEQIMSLLARDGITIDEVNDYHKYPIADNDTPRLSADRLEYSMSNALFTYNLLNIDNVREIYCDIEIQSNEEGTPELGFRTESIACDFVDATSTLSVIYREDRTRYSMQFLADILARLSEKGKISREDLYRLKEAEVIELIERSEYGEVFQKWRKAKKVKTSSKEPAEVYWVHHGSKVRYIDPLVNHERVSKVNKLAKKTIDRNLAYDMSKFVYLDLNF